MKKSILPVKIFISVLVLALISLFVYAQRSDESDTVRRIDDYSKTLNDFVRKNKSPHLIFADISDYEKQRWKKFESEKALDEFRENSESFSIAYNWQINGKIAVSNFTLSGESGDWVKYVHLYFREDGTLAKANSQLSTFYGNFSLLQDIYFDQNGQILKNTSKYLSVKTNEIKFPDKSNIIDNGDRINPFYFMTNDKLPYNHLLKE